MNYIGGYKFKNVYQRYDDFKLSSVLQEKKPTPQSKFDYTNTKGGIWHLASTAPFCNKQVDADSGLTLTRTIASGGTDATDYRGYNSVFSATLRFPSNPTDGLIWESGATGSGMWVGIRDSGTVLRVRGGDGSAAKTASDANTTIIDYTDFPKDDDIHVLTFDWNIDVTGGESRLFIDGVLIQAERSTGTDAFEIGDYSGTDTGTYLATAAQQVNGEPTGACNLTDEASGLRVYANQLVSNYITL